MDRTRIWQTGPESLGEAGWKLKSGIRLPGRASAGLRTMIEATRLNGEKIYLNLIQIESMESIPETKIKMMNGDYFLVKDSVDSIIDQMKALANSVLTFNDKIR